MKVMFLYQEGEGLGVGYISSLLKQNNHQIKLLMDPLLFSDDFLSIKFLAKIFNFKKKIISKILKYNPDIIAFSVVTDTYKWACKFAEDIKKEKNIPIVFGGIHPTSVPERVIKNKFIDFVVVGEGEYAMLELLNGLKTKNFNIKNIWYKKNGKVIKNETRPLIENLDKLPFPDKDIFYENAPYLKKTYYYIMTSRGCPYNCSYCCNNFLRKIYNEKGSYLRRRSVQNVIQELELAKKKYNPKMIAFRDDSFTSNQKWISEFMKEYKKKINLPFKCIGNTINLNENIIRDLKMGGCKKIQIGIQSANEKIRKNDCYRYETNKKIKEIMDILNKYKISVFVDHIFGFPSENKTEIETMHFYNSIRPFQIKKFWLKYYPKTDIINISLKKGILKKEDVEKIENAEFGTSYKTGGSVRNYNYKSLIKIQSLLDILPFLPKSFIRFMINKRLYKLLPPHYLFSVTIRTIVLIFYKELRQDLTVILNRYLFFIKKFYNE